MVRIRVKYSDVSSAAADIRKVANEISNYQFSLSMAESTGDMSRQLCELADQMKAYGTALSNVCYETADKVEDIGIKFKEADQGIVSRIWSRIGKLLFGK